MLMTSNDIIDEIKKDFFTDGELDKEKVLSLGKIKKIENKPYETTIEYGKSDKMGAIRFKTLNNEEPNIVILLSQKFPKYQFAYMSLDKTKIKGIHFVVVKDRKTSMEKWTDLDTRQGRMIFLAANYNPNSKKMEIEREKEL